MADVKIIIKGENQSSKAVDAAADDLRGLADTAETEGGRVDSALSGGFSLLTGGLLAAGASALGGALATGLGSAYGLADELQGSLNQTQAQLGLTGSEAQALGDVATEVFRNNWGGSIGEATAAVGTLQQTLGTIGPDALAGATEGAFALKDVFGVEIPESADAARTLMQNFGLTSQQAFDFLAKGFQSGLDRSGDFLDTIGEYSTQFANGGADAGQFFSLLESGLQGGVLGTDKAADAFKEFGLRIADGSDSSRTALEGLGINADNLWTSMASGQTSTADAFQAVIGKLGEIEDPVQRNAIGVALLGTQYEDLGASAALGLRLAGTSVADMAGATDSLNVKYNDLNSMATGVWRMFQTDVLLPVGESLLNLANSAMPIVSAGIGALGGAITFVKDNATVMGPVLSGVAIVIGGVLVAAFWAWAGSAWAAASGTIAAITPILPIIAAVGGAVALLALAWNTNFLGIQDIVRTVWEGYLQPAFTVLQAWLAQTLTAALATLASVWTGTLQPALSAVWSFISVNVIPLLVDLGGRVFGALQAAITTLAGFWRDTLLPAITAVHDFITTYITPVLTALADVAMAALGLAIATLAGYWKDTLQPAIQAVYDLLNTYVVPIFTALVSTQIENLKTALSGLAGIWTGTLQPALSAMGSFLSSTIQPALDAMKNAVSSIVTFLGNMADAIRNMPSLPDLPGLPHFATGVRNFGGGWAVVGERGPELLRLPRGSDVFSNRESQQMLASAGGGASGGPPTVRVVLDDRGADLLRGLVRIEIDDYDRSTGRNATLRGRTT